MLLTMIFIIGAVVNMIRGGLHGKWRDRVVQAVPNKYLRRVWAFMLNGDTINAAVFGFLIATIPGMTYIGMVDGVPEYILGDNYVLGFFAAIAMFAGSAPGWGKYIGALAGRERENLKEIPQIDDLIEFAKVDPVSWGHLGLVLRGLLWALPVSLSLHTLWPMIGGFCMAFCYSLGFKIFGQKYGWTAGEAFFGGLFWYSCFYGLV